MASTSQPKNKLYHSIGEVAKRFGVSVSLIRHWEKEFDILKPRKSRKGDRLFTEKDIDTLELIYYLVRERGYKLEGAKKKLRENPDDTMQNFKIVQSLKRLRQFLVRLREEI